MAQARPTWSLRAAFGVDPRRPYDAYGAAVLANSPVAFWSLGSSGADRGSSGTTLSTSGGVVQGIEGAVPRSLASRLDGIDDYWFNSSAPAALQFTTAMTFEGWINPRQASGSGPVFLYRIASGGLTAYKFDLTSTLLPRFTCFNGAGTQFTVTGVDPLPVGEYTFVAVSLAASSLKLYVGTPAARTALVATATGPSSIRAGAGEIDIGRDPSSGFGLAMEVDEFALFNTALSLAQLQAHRDRSWFDLAGRVDATKSHFWRRGRKTLLDRFEAGTASWVLRNDDQQLDPLNTSAAQPYVGNVIPDTLVDWSAMWTPPAGLRTRFPRWRGYADQWIVGYDGRGSLTTLTATDQSKFYAEDGPASPLEAEIQTDVPIALWTFDGYNEQTNEVLADSSLTGDYPGTLGQGFTTEQVIPYDVGQGVVIDRGISAGRYTGPIAGAGTAPFSYLGWMKVPPDFGADDAGVGIIASFGATTSDRFALYYSVEDNGPNGALAAQLNVIIGLNSFYVFKNLNDGQPHAIALCFRDTSFNFDLYVDGVVVLAVPSPTNPGSAMTLNDWRIGGSPASWAQCGIYTGTVSAARVLAHYAAGMTGWDGDLSGARIQRLVTMLGIDTATEIDAGNTLLQGSNLDSSLWEHMQRVAQTENGGLWITLAGAIRFRGRHSIFRTTRYAVSQATFGDRGTDLRYETLTPVTDRTRVINKARIGRRGGPVITAINAAARLVTGPRKLELTDLAMRGDNLPRDYANWITSRFGTVIKEFREMVYAPTMGDNDTLTAAYFALELEDRITAKKVPPGGGLSWAIDCNIQSIEEQLNNGSHRVTMALAGADSTQYFTLDDNTKGKLNGGYPLAF